MGKQRAFFIVSALIATTSLFSGCHASPRVAKDQQEVATNTRHDEHDDKPLATVTVQAGERVHVVLLASQDAPADGSAHEPQRWASLGAGDRLGEQLYRRHLIVVQAQQHLPKTMQLVDATIDPPYAQQAW